MRSLLLIATATAFACIPTEECIDGVDCFEPQYEDNFEAEVVATIGWNSNAVVLELENTDPDGIYNFGITENAGSCLDSEWGCWTGEDCHMGFDLTSGGNLSYCHPVEEGRNTISYGASPDAVREGSSTVFGDSSFQSVVTYVLDNYASFEADTCYTWGADTTYYNGFYKQCIEM